MPRATLSNQHTLSTRWSTIARSSAAILSLFALTTTANAQSVAWQYDYGTSASERFTTSLQTADGGYIMGGSSASGDYWVQKLDASRTLQWQSDVGGSGTDELTSLVQTADGGYLLGGHSFSGISGDKTEASQGASDYWIVKLDAQGVKLWDKTVGGSSSETAGSVIETSDGGYILTGDSSSTVGGDVTDTKLGYRDVWVVKLASDRSVQWDLMLGGDDHEFGSNTVWHDGTSLIHQTADGGYLFGATSSSDASGEKSQNANIVGYGDFWVVKLNNSGAVVWDRTLGGIGNDYLHALQPTRDGGFVAGGWSASQPGGSKSATTAVLNANGSYWVVKADSQGIVEWDQSYGGFGVDQLNSVVQTLDDGFLLSGTAQSDLTGNKTVGSYGSHDFWLIKLDANGSESWQEVYGGNSWDWLTSATQTSDGGYLLAGESSSGVSFDKTSPNAGGNDAWMLKLDAPFDGVSAFHFEDPFGAVQTNFPCSNLDIYLNGSASQNESHYYMDAWRRPIGTTGAFTWAAGAGWESGTVETINLTDTFAPFVFAPGYEYQIKVAVQNLPSFNWVENLETFTVPSPQAICRVPGVRGEIGLGLPGPM